MRFGADLRVRVKVDGFKDYMMIRIFLGSIDCFNIETLKIDYITECRSNFLRCGARLWPICGLWILLKSIWSLALDFHSVWTLRSELAKAGDYRKLAFFLYINCNALSEFGVDDRCNNCSSELDRQKVSADQGKGGWSMIPSELMFQPSTRQSGLGELLIGIGSQLWFACVLPPSNFFP